MLLNSHWVMSVLDHCTSRIVGFAVYAGGVRLSASAFFVFARHITVAATLHDLVVVL